MTEKLNVDPQEIAKFEALASRWWDRSGEFRPLHEINPLRANYIDEHSPVSGQQLVDVGCGGGILAESMAQRGATVTGIDMGEAPLSVARRCADIRRTPRQHRRQDCRLDWRWQQYVPFLYQCRRQIRFPTQHRQPGGLRAQR